MLSREALEHFEKLCNVMHGTEATPKNVLQTLGLKAIADIRKYRNALESTLEGLEKIEQDLLTVKGWELDKLDIQDLIFDIEKALYVKD